MMAPISVLEGAQSPCQLGAAGGRRDRREGITGLEAVSCLDDPMFVQLRWVHSSMYAAAFQMDRDGAVVDAKLPSELIQRLTPLLRNRELIDLGWGQTVLDGPSAGV